MQIIFPKKIKIHAFLAVFRQAPAISIEKKRFMSQVFMYS